MVWTTVYKRRMNGKILQIIPAEPGWHVVYEAGAGSSAPGSEESHGIEFVPIACWALFEDETGRAKVVPLTGGGKNIALVINDPHHPKALGISPPGRRPGDWVTKLAPPARQTTSRMSRRPKRRPKPVPKKPVEAAEPAPPPAPEPTPAPEAAPQISMEELIQDAPPVPDTPPAAGGLGIPGGDVLDDDYGA